MRLSGKTSWRSRIGLRRQISDISTPISTPSTYSIIIPYQHSQERLSIFNACLDNLNTILDEKVEICIHEAGKERSLWLGSRYKYLFTPFLGIFHRAWVINRGVRKLASGSMLVLMDGDLIVDRDWASELLRCNEVYAGYSSMNYLSKEATDKYLESGYIDKEGTERVRVPSIGGAAGGITIIPKHLFFTVKGIPEDFAGSWGGEDNAFLSKLRSLGYISRIKKLKSKAYHLWHKPTTVRDCLIQHKASSMIRWSKSNWIKYLNKMEDNWGSSDAISYNRSKPPISIAMLSWLRLNYLKESLLNLPSAYSGPLCLCLRVQGSENLSEEDKRLIIDLSNKFYKSNVYFTKYNQGTGAPRRELVKRSLRLFDSPYMLLADDDVLFKPGSLNFLVNILEGVDTLGAVSSTFEGQKYLKTLGKDYVVRIPLNIPEQFVKTSFVGSASTLFRREVFKTCEIDKNYKVGLWDYDLCMQMEGSGWKAITLTSGNLSIRNLGGGSVEYKADRYNRKTIKESHQLFESKWKLDIRNIQEYEPRIHMASNVC